MTKQFFGSDLEPLEEGLVDVREDKGTGEDQDGPEAQVPGERIGEVDD